MEIIISILTGLIPVLIQQAEARLGKPSSSQDFAWVDGMVKEIVGVLEKFLPAWAKPPIDEIEKLVVELIEKELEKLA